MEKSGMRRTDVMAVGIDGMVAAAQKNAKGRSMQLEIVIRCCSDHYVRRKTE
jgi:hypothetical protein